MTRATIHKRHLKGIDSAGAQWEGDSAVVIEIDGRSVSVIGGVVHELIHVVLDRELSAFEEYSKDRKGTVIREPAELLVWSLEEAITKDILTSRRKKAWWTNAIAKRTVAPTRTK